MYMLVCLYDTLSEKEVLSSTWLCRFIKVVIFELSLEKNKNIPKKKLSKSSHSHMHNMYSTQHKMSKKRREKTIFLSYLWLLHHWEVKCLSRKVGSSWHKYQHQKSQLLATTHTAWNNSLGVGLSLPCFNQLLRCLWHTVKVEEHRSPLQ